MNDEKMMKEAEANKEADEKRKEEADLRNEAEQLIFAGEKSLKDLGDKVDEKDKKKVEEQTADLKKALEGNDIDDIKKKKDALNETVMALATKVYEEAAKAAQAENASNTSNDDKDNDVKEAEYEEK